MAGIGGYVFWTLKGDDIIQNAIQSKVNLLNIPADSIAVSYEEGSLKVYNANLKKYLFKNSKSKDIFNSSLISMNGIDWMEVNELKQLNVDTIEIFIEELNSEFDLLKEMKVAKNNLIKSIHCQKLIVHVERCEIRHIEELEIVKMGQGLIEVEQLVYSYEDKSLKYSNPTAIFKGLSSKINKYRLASSEITANEDEINLVDGEFSNIEKSLYSTFKEINILADFNSFNEAKIIDNLQIKAKDTRVDRNLLESKNDFDLLLKVGNVDFSSERLLVNDNSQKIMEFDRVSTSADNIRLSKKDVAFQNYSFQAGSMQFYDNREYSVHSGLLKIRKGNVSIDQIFIKSRKTPSDLLMSQQKSNTIYNIFVAKAEVLGTTIEDYLSTEKLMMSQLTVTGAKLNVFTDNNVQMETKPKKIISQIIKDIEIPINIPKLRISQSSLIYDLKAKRRADVGRIYINNINGNIVNFSNQNEVLSSNTNMNCQFTGLLMGNAPLTIKVDFNMIDAPNSYRYSGNLKGLHFQDVNRMLEDLTAVRVKKGEFDELLFSMKSNKYRTDGTLEFYYKGLKLIHVEDRTTGIPDPLRLAVNKLVLRQNNIRGRSPKIATVGISHPAEHSNLRCVWESVYTGLETSFLPKIPKPFKRFTN